MILANLIVLGAVAIAMALIALSVCPINKRLAFVIWFLACITFYVMAYAL